MRRRPRVTRIFSSSSPTNFPQSPDDRAKGLNPFAELITRGWLRASHRALDPARSTEMVPYHSHSDPQPLTPNEVYKFEISLEPMAYLIKQGHRLRLEIVNGDSPATEILWSHYYRPDKIGSDTIHHDSGTSVRTDFAGVVRFSLNGIWGRFPWPRGWHSIRPRAENGPLDTKNISQGRGPWRKSCRCRVCLISAG